MKLHFDNNSKRFILSDMDYDMVQLILNGIECERKKIVDKISVLSTYLWKEYSKSQIEEFKIQIHYLKEKNEELKELIDHYNSIIENVPI